MGGERDAGDVVPAAVAGDDNSVRDVIDERRRASLVYVELVGCVVGRGGRNGEEQWPGDEAAALLQIAGVGGAQIEGVGRLRRVADGLDDVVAHMHRDEERADCGHELRDVHAAD